MHILNVYFSLYYPRNITYNCNSQNTLNLAYNCLYPAALK